MFRIREIMKEKGMPPQYLADHMGVSRQYINNILSERGMVSVRTLSRIAEVLQVPVAALFEDSKVLVADAVRAFSGRTDASRGKHE